MTKTKRIRPEEIPPPDWNALRTALQTGAPLTVWRAGIVADPVQTARFGLNGQPNRTGGAGWFHSTLRQEGGHILLLVGNGQGTGPGWRTVATVHGTKVTWTGLEEPNPVQVMRERLICCFLRSLGLTVSAPYVGDGNLLDADRVLVGGVCQKPGCHRPLTTPESLRTGYGPVCGGRVKPPRSWDGIDIHEAARRIGRIP